MSNIFYSEVDHNLQLELNARGKAGFNRTQESLNHMLGKIANVELTAYSGNTATTEIVATLGGDLVSTDRFLPNGPQGYLSDAPYIKTELAFDTSGKAYIASSSFTDTSRRVGPHITSTEITIGDHSMGLLNKATVNISIPNPSRDLDQIEDVWFRPGRFVKIEITHPESAVISKENGGTALLTRNLFPSASILQDRYPGWDIDALLSEIRQMNVTNFEGLITSFEMQYQTNASVDATIQLTGISNTYTDVSMFMPAPDTKQDEVETPTYNYDLKLDTPSVTATAPDPKEAPDPNAPPAQSEFYKALATAVDNAILLHNNINGNIGVANSGIIRFQPNNESDTITDQYVLFGEPYDPTYVDGAELTEEQKQMSRLLLSGDIQNKYSRYISLGALIAFINKHLMSKFNQDVADLNKSIDDLNATITTTSANYNKFSAFAIGIQQQTKKNTVTKLNNIVKNPLAKIMCDDLQCFSNYYSRLKSVAPGSILLLPPSNVSIADTEFACNMYNNLTYYSKVNSQLIIKNKAFSKETWPGVHTSSISSNKMFPSRIFINLEFIKNIIEGKGPNAPGLINPKKKDFSVSTFLGYISNWISYSTAGAVAMNLQTHPNDPRILLYTDTNYLKTPITNSSTTRVTPYSVPMFANHPNGTIVRDFSIQSKLPENAKTLSYVLNSSEKISQEQIAPYMNFMYNSKNPDEVNRILGQYSQSHYTAINNLKQSIVNFSNAPNVPELTDALYNALSEYIKFPDADLRKSQQMTAPIFPFDVSFTIDGINGLRYGDVLTFPGLPLKYQVNTVFSIIGITHTVSTDGQWVTNVRCIMRPSID
jgi:hypothetical protein